MKKRKFTSDFKFKVVLEALSERYSMQELARKHELHASQIAQWKSQFLQNGKEVFSKPIKDAKTKQAEREESLLKTIGQLKVEVDFLKKASE